MRIFMDHFTCTLRINVDECFWSENCEILVYCESWNLLSSDINCPHASQMWWDRMNFRLAKRFWKEKKQNDCSPWIIFLSIWNMVMENHKQALIICNIQRSYTNDSYVLVRTISKEIVHIWYFPIFWNPQIQVLPVSYKTFLLKWQFRVSKILCLKVFSFHFRRKG